MKITSYDLIPPDEPYLLEFKRVLNVPGPRTDMRFPVDEIPEEGLSFAVENEQDDFAIESEDCRLAGPVKVAGALEKVGREVFLQGRVETRLTVTCARCLEEFAFPVKTRVTAHYVPEEAAPPGKAEMELHAEDIDVEFYDGETVDLTQAIHDQILLTLPASCLCRENCRGLCPHCGTNLNLGACECQDETTGDPRLDILKTLKDKIK